MKFVRYAFIAVLLYCLITSIYSYDESSVKINPVGVQNTGLDPALYDSLVADHKASSLTNYRLLSAPWLILPFLILMGWIFSSKRWLVYIVSPLALLLLGHLIFVTLKQLGYTFDQSIYTIFQGYGRAVAGWLVFYFIAIVTLLASIQKKSSAGVKS